MSLPDLTGQNIENTYQRLVQTDGTNFYDGTGSVVNFGTDPFPYTGSAIITGSLTVTGSVYVSDGILTQYIDFDIDTVSPFQEGRIQWIEDTKTLAIDTDVNDFSIEVGHQTVIRGRNETGFDFPIGTVVYIIGGNNSRPLFSTASWENDANSAYTIGIVSQLINNNNNGYAITNGILRNINTSLFTAGDALYLSSSGQITNISPVAPKHNVRLGKVISATNNGIIYVDIDNGYELGELHNVLDTGSRPGDLLVVSNSLWVNSKQLTGSYGLTGSLTATSLTSSLFGTSSWATNALIASYVQNAQTASYVLNAISSSFASTASYVQNAQTASHLNSLTQNVEILGNVTIHGTASVDVLVTNYQSSSIIYSSGSTKFGDTLDDTHEFTGSIFTTGSISSTNTVTATTGSFSYLQGNSPIVVGDPVTFQQAITASSISASVIYGNGSNLTGISSSSFSATSSFTPNAIVTVSATPGNYTMRLTKGDGSFFDVTLTAPAPLPPPITDTGSFFTNATLNSDRIVFTKGDRSTLNLSLTSSYVLISQTSSFTQTSSFNTFTQSIQSSVDSLINSTSSFVQNSQTSSFVLNSQTSSMLEPYVLTSTTSSFVQNSQTSSFIQSSQTSSMLEPYVLISITSSMLEPYVLSSQTSSFVVNSQTSSFVQNSQTSSFVQNSQTSSMLEPYVLTIVTSSMLAPYVLNSQTSSFVQNSQTSSMTVLSSSYSLTASYLNTPQFSSVVELGGTLTITNVNYNIYLGKTIILTGSSAKNFNLNYSPTSPGLGDEFYIIQSGSGQVTTSGSGVTILSATGSLPKTRAEYSSMAVKHIGSNRWIVVGDITA